MPVRKVSLIVTVVLCASIGVIIVMMVLRAVEKKGSPSHLRRIAAQINAQAPKKIDDAMEMTSAESREQQLSIHYRLLTRRASDIDAVTLRTVREVLRKDSCTKRDVRDLLDGGATMRYIISDADNVNVLTTEILRWECTAD